MKCFKHVFTFFAQAKVCYPYKAICIHQQIIQLQIPDTHTHTRATETKHSGHAARCEPTLK